MKFPRPQQKTLVIEAGGYTAVNGWGHFEQDMNYHCFGSDTGVRRRTGQNVSSIKGNCVDTSIGGLYQSHIVKLCLIAVRTVSLWHNLSCVLRRRIRLDGVFVMMDGTLSASIAMC